LEPAKVQIIEHRLGGRLVRRTRLFQWSDAAYTSGVIKV
jgi:hypothetical protein